MRLIIPAAGMGFRLSGAAQIPKFLVPLQGRPLISHILRIASATGLFSQTVIILGPYYEAVLDTIEGLLSRIEWQSDMEVVCIRNPKFETTNNVYSLYLAREYLEGNIVIHNCDVLVSLESFAKLASKNAESAAWVLAERMSPVPQEETKIVASSHDGVAEIGEEISSSVGQGRYVGVCSFSSGASNVFRNEIESFFERGELGVFYTKAIKALARRGMLRVVWTEGLPWLEIDTLEDLQLYAPKVNEIVSRIHASAGKTARTISLE